MSDKNPRSVVTALTSLNSAQGHVALSAFVHSNPQLASSLALLTTPERPAKYDNRGNREISRPNTSDLKLISGKIARTTDDAEAVLQLFSDVKIAAEILISSIRSPNDMYDGDVLFELKDGLNCSPIAGVLLPLIRSYFSDVYPLAEKFEDILRGTLFGAGSYPVLVLPENSLSEMIHNGSTVSTESLKNILHSDQYPSPLGLLGEGPELTNSQKTTALERATGLHTKRGGGSRMLTAVEGQHKITCPDVIINDNPLSMFYPLMGKIAQQRTLATARERYTSGKSDQSASQMSDRDIANLLYRKSTGRRSEFVKVKTSNEIQRYSVGRPLILELPPESVVPVINRGRPNDPVGYVVLIDSDGVPLSRLTEIGQFEALKKSVDINPVNGGYGDMSSYLLQRTAAAFGTNCAEITLRQVNKIFGEILEADLAARLRNGAWGNELTVSNSERLSELMLHRVLQKQHTQLLFIPESMLTYFNYQVNDNGTGKNLLQDCMTISSMRAQVLFARVLSSLKNSIGRTKVAIDIDPDDPDSRGTSEIIKNEVVRARQMISPNSSVNPTDVLNHIQAAGLEFEITGAKGLPDTKVQFSETSTSYVRPDDELSKELTDLLINHIGVPPEMIEDARRPEFATVAIANNILFSKLVRRMQQRYDPQLGHLARNMLLSDNTFIIELKKVIKENLNLVLQRDKLPKEIEDLKDQEPALIELLSSEFISGLKATLARPDLKSIDSNLEALQKHEELIDKALSNIFSQDAVDPSLVGQATYDKIEAVRKAAKAALMRRFMTENGLAQDAFDLISTDDSGVMSWDLRTEVTQFSSMVAKVMLDISEKGSRIANAADQEQGKLSQPDSTAEPVDTSTSSSDSNAGGGSEDGGDFGGLGDIPLS